MGYRELLQALEEEVGRQARELRAEASRERELLLETTRRELSARRERMLGEERGRLKSEAALSLSKARLEQERVSLGEMRQQMAELQRGAEARLSAMDDSDLLARLVDELVPELGVGPVEFRVMEGHEESLRSHLGRQHPALLNRATILGSPDARGGVEISLGGRQLLDNTLPSRLRNAWQILEAEIAAMLFGEVRDQP